MAEKKITCGKTEIVIYLKSQREKYYNLLFNQIRRIQFSPVKEFRWFRNVPSEKIEIDSSKYPIFVFTKIKNQEYWEDYKKELAGFAERNYIKLVNDIESQPEKD